MWLFGNGGFGYAQPPLLVNHCYLNSFCESAIPVVERSRNNRRRHSRNRRGTPLNHHGLNF